MDDSFLDTSWTIYHHPINNAQTYRGIFASAQNHTTYQDRLTTYLTTQTDSGPKDDFNDEIEKSGALKQCQFKLIPRPSSTVSSKKSVVITIIYDKQIYKFILFSPFLTLIKAPVTQTKLIHDWLGLTFGITLQQLKLAPTSIHNILAGYITTLSGHTNHDYHEDGDGNEEDLTRLSLFKTAVTNLKLSITFSGSVAPLLKSIDLDVPYESVLGLSEIDGTNVTGLSAGSNFMTNLEHYITEHTGLKLPLSLEGSDSTPEGPARLSRVSTAFWVLGAEGKIKFSGRVVEFASGIYADIVRRAGADILLALDREGRRRSAGSD